MEGSSISRSKGRPRNTINETIKNYLDFNDLSRDIVYDRFYGIV